MKKINLLLLFITFLAAAVFAQNEVVQNGTVLEDKTEKGHKVLTIKHYQKLTLGGYAKAYQLVVYNSPIEKKEIGHLNGNEKIIINDVCKIDSKETFLKINYKNDKGYLLYKKANDKEVRDIYESDVGFPTETIKSGKTTYHTMKINQSFLVYTNLNIRDKPGLESKKIGMIKADGKNAASVTAIELTTESDAIDGIADFWAKVKYGDITGWVFAGYLEVERGGPKYINPESIIRLELGEEI